MAEKEIARPAVGAAERAEIGNAASNFRIDCTAGNPARQLKISDFLGIGAETGLTIRDLERMTGKPGREIRREIQQERLAGVPILADNPNGYFLPRNEFEKQTWVRSMFHRADEISRSASAIFSAEVVRVPVNQRTAQEWLQDNLDAQYRAEGV